MKLTDYKSNCCAVALHEVCDKPEDDVIRACILWSKGFPYGRGMHVWEWKAAAASLGLQLENAIDIARASSDHEAINTILSRQTLSKFCRTFRTGAYIVRVRRHVLVVRDGVIIDPNWKGVSASRRRVLDAYRVLNPSTSKNVPAVSRQRGRQLNAHHKHNASYGPDPEFQFTVAPSGRRRCALQVYAVAYKGWVTMSTAEKFGYTRKEFRSDARAGRIKIKEKP